MSGILKPRNPKVQQKPPIKGQLNPQRKSFAKRGHFKIRKSDPKLPDPSNTANVQAEVPVAQNAKWRRMQWYAGYMKNPETRLPILLIPKKASVSTNGESTVQSGPTAGSLPVKNILQIDAKIIELDGSSNANSVVNQQLDAVPASPVSHVHVSKASDDLGKLKSASNDALEQPKASKQKTRRYSANNASTSKAAAEQSNANSASRKNNAMKLTNPFYPKQSEQAKLTQTVKCNTDPITTDNCLTKPAVPGIAELKKFDSITGPYVPIINPTSSPETFKPDAISKPVPTKINENEPLKPSNALLNPLNFIVSNGQRTKSSNTAHSQNYIQTQIIEHDSVYSSCSANSEHILETSAELSCGHYVRFSSCDPISEFGQDLTVYCPAPCKEFYPCGHPCRKLCYEECGQCSGTQHTVYTCRHEARIPCAVKGTDLDICHVQVPSNVSSSCGHPVNVSCALKDSLEPNQVAQKCKDRCGAEFVNEAEGCGHKCQGSCLECRQGRFHVRCSQPCGRTLICGHVCTTPCSQACPPCKAHCEAICEHGPCADECGFPCDVCEEPCVWKCPHQKCTMKCSEVCNRGPCDEPCPKLLSCGHPCVSFCGDPCPKLCRICNTDELEAGLILSKDFLEESDRFVLLEDCGHAIEKEMLDQWMNIPNHDSEIYHKVCPLCRKVIYRCRRYIGTLHKTRMDIEQIKGKIYGDLSQIKKIQEEAKELLSLEFDLFQDFKNYLLNSMDFQMLNLRQSESLAHLTRTWFEVQYKMADLKSHIPEKFVCALESNYRRLFDQLTNRPLPLQTLELRDLRRQLDRFHGLSQLYERRSSRSSGTAKFLGSTPEARNAFHTVEDICWSWEPYDDELKTKFRIAMLELDETLQCKLGITDEERQEIVQAVGLSSGRWFKCPNGHVYLITECGGATQTSTCSECGLRIGGEGHRVLSDNRLATEMDGALIPAYPGSVH